MEAGRRRGATAVIESGLQLQVDYGFHGELHFGRLYGTTLFVLGVDFYRVPPPPPPDAVPLKYSVCLISIMRS